MTDSPLIGIIMGSRSDWETMRHAAELLTELGIAHECRIVSAHRTPDRLYDYAKGAAGRGLKAIIAGAGGAAHLPGMTASMTRLPVLGVPVELKALKGMDSLLSIVQMPAGVPVGTLAIGPAGATNAALLAAAIVANGDEAIAERLEAWRQAQTDGVGEDPGGMSETAGGALPPGSTIGIVGGGQLGRMLAIAAAQLGYRCHIFAPDAAPCAAEVAATHIRAAYDDEEALARFAGDVDIVTYEFENIPAAPLKAIKGRAGIHPSCDALELAQDRLHEKDYVLGHGGRPADYRAVASLDDLRAALDAIGAPAILKTRRFGYDGKGQVRIASPGEAESAWRDIGGRPAVLEALVPFEREFSIILARGRDGGSCVWDAPDNRHEDGILATVSVPGAGLIVEQKAAATSLAIAVADALDYVGVLAMEFFACEGGPVFNEMAPRVHNSGHWTIEGAVTSQFENHIRAICGLPLGATALTAGRVEMRNLIGEDAGRWRDILADDRAHLHLYGKREARPGRKMGHVTRLL